MSDSSVPRREPGPSLPAPAASPEPDPSEDGAPPAEGYDPADYRWVPVRRRPRRDGWTPEKQRRFIEALADTGVVSLAAKAVGLTRESAYKLRRSAHGAAFARAWDAARHHAGGFVEDVAFERAIEGEERPVFNEYGEVIATRHVHNDRLLMFLLRHLKPERYGRDALREPPPPAPGATLEASLRAMEPLPPAPIEGLLDAETLAHELDLADVADGVLPHFLSEQRPAKSAEQLKREEWDAQEERGEAAWRKLERKEGEPSARAFADICRYLDPAGRAEPPRKRYR